MMHPYSGSTCVYSDALLVEQFDYYAQYQKGFFNSVLGQEGVRKTTDGTNFLAMHDDVYMYTGVTSVTADQSIVGFTLINQRTKEAKFYPVEGGATESLCTGFRTGYGAGSWL